MYVKELTLKNYRNYESEVFKFIDGINILVGNNAQGKTNCVEALFYLCTGYSPRAGRDRDIIKEGERSAEARAICESRFGLTEVKIDFLLTKKNISVNGVPIKKSGELMGNINSVFFNPGELRLIQNVPEDRRRFMDISISQMDRQYYYTLQTYRKILEQRNNLLKSEDLDTVNQTLPLWDKELSRYAVEIINKRREFIDEIKPYAIDEHSKITDGSNLEFFLETPHYTGGGEEEIFNLLRSRVEKDLILGYTTIGPHRDDIKINVNGKDVKIYGSQGQQRTVAVSLKLAECMLFNKKFGEYPVLILDDALSELDYNRRDRLIERLSGFQTIITLTEIPEELKSKDAKIFRINNGKIE